MVHMCGCMRVHGIIMHIIHIRIHVRIHTHTCTFMCMCLCTCTFMFVCLCSCTCMCVFMHVCIMPLSIYIIIIIIFIVVAVVAVALFDRAMKTYFCRYNIPVVKFNIYIYTMYMCIYNHAHRVASTAQAICGHVQEGVWSEIATPPRPTEPVCQRKVALLTMEQRKAGEGFCY